MSLGDWSGALKDKLRLSLEILPHALLQPFRITQVRVRAENIGQTILQADHIDKREELPFVELASQINVGVRSSLTPSDRPVQMQMDNPGRFQFRFMGTQRGNDLFAIHGNALP
jgi:hypothetical protein